MATKIEGCSIFSQNEWKENGYLVFDKDKIVGIGFDENSAINETIRFPETYKCLPGMIDMHIHGANGSDTMDATPEALSTIASALVKEGTTSFLATTITQSVPAIEKAVANAGETIGHQKPGEAEILGIHLEGPFINKEKTGAQPIEYILEADRNLFDQWQKLSGNKIKEVTLAPETKGGLDLIRHLASQGVVASIGHTNGTDDDVIRAIDAGATQVTHLFNGMRGMHHREPGILGGALLHHELYTELICDGHHVCQGMVNLAYKLKGSDRMILITDAMRAKCLKKGVYDLGGQDVYVDNGLAVLKSGTIAGSVLKMDESLRNILAFTDATLADVVQMGAINPAMQCGVFDRKGSLEVGKDADFIVLNEHNELVLTVCRGTIAFQKKEGR
ncbi:N-acetylglucosamine-6-phosphate deacetylase [Sporolactobacillus laevolacticus]|uniref:N-acetylglucosamine-6-phosphate deacetylase n=1 Tax=Sporolactobacillus laevolacticus DSM 442 TaxID=1395513 RepID=V6IZA4_9BACL|nr:N-acetylglucosamine-6-phosphate deacetylase [Sporolactobacillus laevolacticus]EST12151.1 N-acetylglucosamine-6-phosphate deacetylase [Sporolactobacillus laevolacticus DSM 442]